MRVKIISSNHPDIPIGTEGTVVQDFGGGKSVMITALFFDPNEKKTHKETREIYFANSAIEILEDAPNPNSTE